MEQDHPVKDREQDVVWEEAEDGAEWAVIARGRAPEESVYVLIASYPYRIKQVSPVITGVVLNVAPRW